MLRLALMSSENRAAAALVRTTTPAASRPVVAAMNRKAQALGMTHTRFVDGHRPVRRKPLDAGRSGAHGRGRQSATPPSAPTPPRRPYTIKVGRYPPPSYRNTNPLVRNPQWDIDVTKTGYLNEAGRCLVMKTTITGKPVVMVLMNSVGSLTRVGDANRVRRWLETSPQATQVSSR